ncbi:hypothetical protein R2R70_02195 [Cobetia sp. SIMBA_158]|uniref:hypothetical protein n=1 Tax=Cobetia sp. SIMBA_158 TaxID=3081617 RepID=UPI003980DA02
MPISQLIEQLEALKAEHGDIRVFLSAGDYPGPLDSLRYVTPEQGDGYVWGDSIVLRT